MAWEGELGGFYFRLLDCLSLFDIEIVFDRSKKKRLNLVWLF